VARIIFVVFLIGAAVRTLYSAEQECLAGTLFLAGSSVGSTSCSLGLVVDDG
jgi:hypothetical protein